MNLLTDADVQQFDAGPGPLGDHDIALQDITQQAKQQAVKPVDPRPAIEQRFLGERQKLDKMYQGLAKSNKDISYGHPPGSLSDQQQAQYNHAAHEIETRKQAELAQLPAMGLGAVVQGPTDALVGEAGPEVLLHQDGSQELLAQPQVRQLGTSGTDQVVPLVRPKGPAGSYTPQQSALRRRYLPAPKQPRAQHKKH